MKWFFHNGHINVLVEKLLHSDFTQLILFLLPNKYLMSFNKTLKVLETKYVFK